MSMAELPSLRMLVSPSSAIFQPHGHYLAPSIMPTLANDCQGEMLQVVVACRDVCICQLLCTLHMQVWRGPEL